MRTSDNNLWIPISFQLRVIGKRKMVDNEQHFDDVSTQPDICSTKPSQMATNGREDAINDVDDDDIGTKMNKQVLLKDLSPTKARLNYN